MKNIEVTMGTLLTVMAQRDVDSFSPCSTVFGMLTVELVVEKFFLLQSTQEVHILLSSPQPAAGLYREPDTYRRQPDILFL
jgi:hypothetical protein